MLLKNNSWLCIFIFFDNLYILLQKYFYIISWRFPNIVVFHKLRYFCCTCIWDRENKLNRIYLKLYTSLMSCTLPTPYRHWKLIRLFLISVLNWNLNIKSKSCLKLDMHTFRNFLSSEVLSRGTVFDPRQLSSSMDPNEVGSLR